MNLASRIAALAKRIGAVVKTKADIAHPGVARAWVCFGHVGGKLVVYAAHSVGGVKRLGPGRYRVNFSTPLPDSNYCWTALARSSADTGQQRIAVVRENADGKTVQFVEVCCATVAGNFTDSSEINLVVYR